MDTIVQTQTQHLDYLETTKQLNSSTHTYRTGLSTTSSLIEITNRIYEAIDNRDITSIMTVDQSAAFDCMEHALLLDKLRMYSISEESLGLIYSYLSLRTQFVSIG